MENSESVDKSESTDNPESADKSGYNNVDYYQRELLLAKAAKRALLKDESL
jgi:hypothetical protein